MLIVAFFSETAVWFYSLHEVKLKRCVIFVLMNIITTHINQLNSLCSKHHVKELYVFGSVLSDHFREDSDIDFLVQFESVQLSHYFDNYMSFKEQLERLLNRPVDLVENQAVRNPVFRFALDRDKKLVYERKSA